MQDPILISVALLVIFLLVVVWLLSKLREKVRERKEEKQRQLGEERLRLRRSALIDRFGEVAAEMILSGRIAQGMTSEQLLESWGRPADVDRKVFKTKTRETWKYGEVGRNRYRDRVFLENEVIIGWDQK